MEKEKNNNSNYNSYLEFEGEFLNGKKHGNAKEYNEEKILIFEGKYLYIIILFIFLYLIYIYIVRIYQKIFRK